MWDGGESGGGRDVLLELSRPALLNILSSGWGRLSRRLVSRVGYSSSCVRHRGRASIMGAMGLGQMITVRRGCDF